MCHVRAKPCTDYFMDAVGPIIMASTDERTEAQKGQATPGRDSTASTGQVFSLQFPRLVASRLFTFVKE